MTVNNKPLEYQLVDLLGDELITDVEREAVRVTLLHVAGLRRKEAEQREESELDALRQDMEKIRGRETSYLNALLAITNLREERAAVKIAGAALYGPCGASAIEARSDATPQSGAAEGESAAPKEDAHE